MFRAPCFSLVFGLFSAAGFAQSAAYPPTAPSALAAPKTEENPISSPVAAAPTAGATSSVPVSAPEPALANPLGEARALYRKGNFDGAIARYQEFLKDHPNSPDAFAG